MYYEKDERECVGRLSGSEKKHLTFVLSATSDGRMFPPMIIFKEKIQQTIYDSNAPPGSIIKTQKKAWDG